MRSRSWFCTPASVVGAIAVFAVLITSPFYGDCMPTGHDWIFHVLNSCEYAGSLQNGIVVAHLSPTYFGGLGGINFKYYPPYSYLPVSALILLGVSTNEALAVGCSLAFILSGLGMYCFARLRFGRGASLAAALLYLAAPFHVFDLFRRLAYPELWGWAVAPWVFWLAGLAASEVRRWPETVLPVVLALSGLLHALSSLMIAILLPLFWFCRTGLRLRSFRRLATVYLVAFLLGAFYAVPALLDRGDILMSRQFDSAGGYVGQGLDATDYLSFTPRVEGRRPVPGPFLLLLGIAGSAIMVTRDRKLLRKPWRESLCIPALAALSLAFASKAGSFVFSRIFPPVIYLQFPWRFLLPASVFLAFAAGAVVASSETRRWRAVGATLVTALSVVLALVRGWPVEEQPAPSLEWYRTYIVRWPYTGDAHNKYCPVWAYDATEIGYRKEPNPTIWLAAGTGQPRMVHHDFETISFEVDDAGSSWTVVLRYYYVPGWIATSDSGQVSIGVDPATGLMQIRGAACSGMVTLRYVGTRSYRIGVWLSVVGLLVLAWRVWRSRRAWRSDPAE